VYSDDDDIRFDTAAGGAGFKFAVGVNVLLDSPQASNSVATTCSGVATVLIPELVFLSRRVAVDLSGPRVTVGAVKSSLKLHNERQDHHD
jgi:hypothetical protein